VWHGCSTSREHTAPDVTPCRSSPPRPIIGLSALLRLAAWCQRRQDPAPGEAPWLVSTTPQSPPHAPAEGGPDRLILLWQELPPPARQKALRTLSRLVGEQMRQAPIPAEVPHEQT
jgi:hypothetical protein